MDFETWWAVKSTDLVISIVIVAVILCVGLVISVFKRDR